MRTPLAWFNLVHQKARTLVALAGVAFAVILIFMQLGFHGSVLATATLLYDKLDFDIALTSPEYLHTGQAGSFPRERLAQALAVDGVDRAVPLYIGFNRWLNQQKGTRRHIMILAFRVGDTVFRPEGIAAMDFRLGSRGEQTGPVTDFSIIATALSQPDTCLMDRLTRQQAFGPTEPGITTEVGSTQVTVIGEYTLGAGFGGDGTILASDRTFARIFSPAILDAVPLGLLKVKPGASPDEVTRKLNAVLPADVKARTRAEIDVLDQNHWAKSTSIGTIFSLGVVVAFIVGIVFVYQVISSDITNHLPEYATLKAIGYSNRYLYFVILQQACLMAVLGYLPGLAIAAVLYVVTSRLANIPITMDSVRAVSVLALSVAMCLISGLFSMQKLRSADPADLY
jgi:putative ABC transport system permease protein